MSDYSPLQPGRFRSTAALYARFRLGYPASLIDRVIAATGLKAGDPVLDLGAGPGPLALGFAAAGMTVTAVDPEPEMLEALENIAKSAQLTVRALAGSSGQMPPGIGPFRLVTIGRAFHWMDRTETAKDLDRLVLPGGALALFEEVTLKTVENCWRQTLDTVAARYGAASAPHRQERADPTHRAHESVLLGSPFCRLETIGEIVHRTLSVDDIVGFAGSLSVTSRAALGERADAFEAELRAALTALDGRFEQIAEMRVLLARRGSPQ